MIKFIRTYRREDKKEEVDPSDRPGLFTTLEFENLDEEAIAQGYSRKLLFNLYSFKKTRGIKYMIEKGIDEKEAIKILEKAEQV